MFYFLTLTEWFCIEGYLCDFKSWNHCNYIKNWVVDNNITNGVEWMFLLKTVQKVTPWHVIDQDFKRNTSWHIFITSERSKSISKSKNTHEAFETVVNTLPRQKIKHFVQCTFVCDMEHAIGVIWRPDNYYRLYRIHYVNLKD